VDIMPVVRAVDWARYGAADPDEVIAAFESLVAAHTDADAQDAHRAVYDLLINDHSGEVYATAVPAAPLLARVAERYDGVRRAVALSLLCDLMGLTDGHEVGPAVAALVPLLRRLSSGRLNKPIPAMAHELLQGLDRLS
jgi:hypothetical protein